MAIREGFPTISGPVTLPHNQCFAISERAKRWGWENFSGWHTNLVFIRIPLNHCSFTETLKHEVWGTSEFSLLPPEPSRLCIFCSGRAQICLWESDTQCCQNRQTSPLDCHMYFTLSCSGTANVWKYKIFNCKRQSQCHRCRLPQMRVEELQSKWSVHLLRSPHFLNCGLIVQADHNLTGHKKRIVTSKLVK